MPRLLRVQLGSCTTSRAGVSTEQAAQNSALGSVGSPKYIHTYIHPSTHPSIHPSIHPGLYIILYSILLASCAVQPSDPPCHRLAHRGCSEQRAQGLPSLHMAVTFLLRLSQSTHELSAERAGVGNAAANSVCLSLCRTRQSSTAIAIAIATITTNSRPSITDDGGGHRGRGSRPL